MTKFPLEIAKQSGRRVVGVRNYSQACFDGRIWWLIFVSLPTEALNEKSMGEEGISHVLGHKDDFKYKIITVNFIFYFAWCYC